MALTLRDLLARPDLQLRLVVEGAEGVLDTPLTWAHSTELLDPAPFVEGGELLLTTGLQFTGQQGWGRCRDLVDNLTKAGVPALGLGTGLHHDSSPRALIDAADAAGIALIEVPPPTPFIAITRAMAYEQSRAEHEKLRTDHRNQRRLIASAATAGSTHSIVKRTAELLGGWAALVDDAGRLIHASHPGIESRVQRALAGRANRLGEVDVRREDDTELVCYPLSSPTGRPIGHLVAGVEGPVGSLDHSLVSVAGTLLALAVSRTARADQLMRRLRSTVMRRLLDDRATADGVAAKDVWGGLPNAPILVARVGGTEEDLSRAQDALDPWLQEGTQSPDPIAFGEVGDALWIVVSAIRAPSAWTVLEGVGGLTIGASRPGGWDEVGMARSAASAAWRHASESGARFEVEGDESTIMGALGPDGLATLARARLAPLLDGRGDDVSVLRAWLRRHGQYDPAAKDLGIHRHTLRRRIGEIGQTLDLDLDNPTVRAELWLACAAVNQG